ncbi:MAG TPA: hypothetical protein K8V05_08965 [Butyricimonas virosa]|uniref:Uncharacterized protein n=1 Tax=Butyricimonas virosa TaxID=544645 RepID=A0A921L0A0_9BACT|nr:hypothetical protein [Butyricimonas virosa]
MFTTKCFIRINTPELRSKLKKMGYRVCRCTEETTAVYLMAGHGDIHAVHDESVDIFEDEVKSGACKLIDCGDNEQLFLALVAMRDDTDNDQLFTNGIDWAIKREAARGLGLPGFEYLSFPRDMDTPLHKATKEEIIEQFKKENA